MSLTRHERSFLTRQITRYMARRGGVDIYWVPAERLVKMRSVASAYGQRRLPRGAVHAGRYSPGHPVEDILDDLDVVVVGEHETPSPTVDGNAQQVAA